MTNEQREKYSRLQDRLKELKDLNDKIGKLCFFINTETENGNGNEVDDLMTKQLYHMVSYRACLEDRIDRGIY